MLIADHENKITCAGCGNVSIEVHPMRGKGFSKREFLISKKWRVSSGRPYCPVCRNKGKGGINAIKINGLWYTEKELEKYIKKMP